MRANDTVRGAVPRACRLGSHGWPSLLCLVVAGLFACVTTGQEAVPPRAVEVLPVFIVPADQAAPSDDQAERLMRHVRWTQARYRELLGGQISFRIADQALRRYRSRHDLAFYRAQPENSAPQQVGELLADLACTRCNCPYVLVAVLMNAKDGFPIGGGRPLNGGYDTGGGIVILSSFSLDRSPNFQSTLQHELGHAFGLLHVDAYGYDMKSNDSIMSYNRRHHTTGFTPSATPGQLIPEDRRGLALNQRAFPGLAFDPGRDVPPGYALVPRIPTLGPMTIPGQPGGMRVTTDSGEDYGSGVARIVQGRIGPNLDTGTVTFDPNTMWHSAKSATGWVSVQITFPYEVELTGVRVHSQHSGRYHTARAARLACRGAGGEFSRIAEADLKAADATLAVPRTKGREWRLELQAGESGYVVVRGLQFLSGDDELFPPLVPCRE